jgi:hypothetical protein
MNVQIPYTPLPRAPDAWEKGVGLPAAKESFEDPWGSWSEIIVEKLQKSDRPDPNYRRHYPTLGGSLSFNDLGNSMDFPKSPAGVMAFDGTEQVTAKAALSRAPYRISVHPLGERFAIMSKDCVFSAYGRSLEHDPGTLNH